MSRVKLTREQAKALGLESKPPKLPKPEFQASKFMFLTMCRAHGIPAPEPEYKFAPGRKWLFDWAWPCPWAQRLALEIQGAIFTQGRHTRGAALLKEHEKLNEAACLGWRVLYCTPNAVKSGAIFPIIKRALEGG